jgi:integrase
VSNVMLKKEEAKNARKVFFEWNEFQALLEATQDEDLKDYYWFGYLTGWRSGSIKKLEWEDVDMKRRTILSRAEDQKTGEKNFMPMDEELYGVIERRWKRRTYENADGVTAISRFVFHRNNGQKIGDIRKTWANTCKEAGLVKPLLDKEGNVITKEVDGKETAVMIPSKLFHDFRRTAARDTYMATSKKEYAKAITGHKTDAMFDRYNIIVDNQKRETLQARMRMVKTGKVGQ